MKKLLRDVLQCEDEYSVCAFIYYYYLYIYIFHLLFFPIVFKLYLNCINLVFILTLAPASISFVTNSGGKPSCKSYI